MFRISWPKLQTPALGDDAADFATATGGRTPDPASGEGKNTPPPSGMEIAVLGARTGSSTTLVAVIMSSRFVVTKHPVGVASSYVSWPNRSSNLLELDDKIWNGSV